MRKHKGNKFYFQIPQHIHFFSGVIIELKMMVSGLNHLLARVKRSDLVQSGRDTFPDVVGRANTGLIVINHNDITLGTSQKYSFGLIWTHLGLWRPLEAKPNTQW